MSWISTILFILLIVIPAIQQVIRWLSELQQDDAAKRTPAGGDAEAGGRNIHQREAEAEHERLMREVARRRELAEREANLRRGGGGQGGPGGSQRQPRAAGRVVMGRDGQPQLVLFDEDDEPMRRDRPAERRPQRAPLPQPRRVSPPVKPPMKRTAKTRGAATASLPGPKIGIGSNEVEGTAASRSLRRVLRNPKRFRQAFITKELLDVPVGLR